MLDRLLHDWGDGKLTLGGHGENGVCESGALGARLLPNKRSQPGSARGDLLDRHYSNCFRPIEVKNHEANLRFNRICGDYQKSVSSNAR